MQTMRAMVAALISLAVLAWVSDARAQTYPWCAMTDSVGVLAENCGFTSYAQCEATIRGQGGFCQRNLRYQAEPEQRSKRRGSQRDR